MGNVMKLQVPGPEADTMVEALILMKWEEDTILHKQQIWGNLSFWSYA